MRRKGELAELIVNMTVTKDENYLDYEKYFIFPGLSCRSESRQ